MEHYATVPSNKPSNTAIYQLPAVNVAGSKFYGWKMVYFKSVDTGKKDKQGNEIIKQVPDKARPATFDSETQQLMSNKQNRSILAQLMLQNAQQKQINAKLMLQLAKLSKGDK